MSDLIDRQDAIRDIRSMDVCVMYDDTCSTEEAVEKAIVATKRTAIFGLECMHSAEPERQKGKWINLDSDEEKYDDIKCSNCKKIFTVDAYRWCDIGFTVDDLIFCPNCGYEME